MDWTAPTGDVPVLVPWRADNGSREALWDVLRPKVWSQASIHLGESPEGLFNRSAAINDAAEKAGKWEFAIIADADSFVKPQQLANAIDFAQKTGKVTLPYSAWTTAMPEEFDQLWETGTLPSRSDRTTHLEAVSSVIVVPRKVWDRVNGFDERFVGWGFEDNAFMEAVRVLGGGYNRMSGHVFHLEHDRPEETADLRNSPIVRANRDRFGMYLRSGLKSDMSNLTEANRVLH